MILSEKIKKFEALFGTGGEILTFFAPGRVNLIGEHTDYNGGSVFPAAISLGICGIIRYRNDGLVRLRSENEPEEVDISINEDLNYEAGHGWANYPLGVMKYLLKDGLELKGADILYSGDLPVGAGLSSSAAIEVLTGHMMLYYHTCSDNIDRICLSKLCKSAENEFIGLNCGIMDQFTVAMGKKDNAILLNCDTLQYRCIHLKLGIYSLVIINSNKKRALSESRYNERRAECEKALSLIRQHREIPALCHATYEDISVCLKDQILVKRACHLISENERVFEAVNALERQDLAKFGSLLLESHMSLKNDYEVTGFELDTIVNEAVNFQGCIGARMTGAGFGGCAIALVETSQIEFFKDTISKNYYEKTGLKPEFYITGLEDGVRRTGLR
jgi:galactokinase